MSGLGKTIRSTLVSVLGILLLGLGLLLGGAWWTVATQSGTQWLVSTVVPHFKSHVEGIQGSIWQGLRIKQLIIHAPGVTVQAHDLVLQVMWADILQRRLRIQELAATHLAVLLESSPPTEQRQRVLSLPLDITVERLRLGALVVKQDARPIPIQIRDVQAQVNADAAGVRLRIESVLVDHRLGRGKIQGEATLQQLAAPWPLLAQLQMTLQGKGAKSPLCEGELIVGRGRSCQVVADAHVQGPWAALQTNMTVHAPHATLGLQAVLTPQAHLPLSEAALTLRLSTQKTVASAAVTVTRDAALDMNRLQGTVKLDRLNLDQLNLGALFGKRVPSALLTMATSFELDMTDTYVVKRVQVDGGIDPASRWNNRALSGRVSALATTLSQPDAADWVTQLEALRLEPVEIDLRLGQNRLRLQGDMASTQSALTLDTMLPDLAAFWPGLAPGTFVLQGKWAGMPQRHQLTVRAHYLPKSLRHGQLGRSRMDLTVAATGAWDLGQAAEVAATLPGKALPKEQSSTAAEATQIGWRGKLTQFKFAHAGFDINIAQPISAFFLPQALPSMWQWQVGAAQIKAGLPGNGKVTIDHAGSRGGAGRWETAGHINNVVLIPTVLDKVRRAVESTSLYAVQSGSERLENFVSAAQPLALDIVWDLRQIGALSGRLSVVRRSGDLQVPRDTPVPFGLRKFALHLTATPTAVNNSQLVADFQMATAKMGALHTHGAVMLAANAAGGITLASQQPIDFSLQADIRDLQWIELFASDEFNLGGALQANVHVQGTRDGPWRANGTLRGQSLRITRIDEGVRLRDGTLEARLQGDELIIDSLRFSSLSALRTLPKERRLRAWLLHTPEVKNGYVETKGKWRFTEGGGKVQVLWHHFPLLQRLDRYAVVSGQITIEATLPKVRISGDVTADAGWASIDMADEVPTLDDDVRVRASNEKWVASEPRWQTDLNLKVDLGQRFYLTGRGIDTGLEGAIQIYYVNNVFTARGAFHTRGGRIEIYGQNLNVKHGNITFQGRLDNPLLDIQALRTGEVVEAGVWVTGTARQRIVKLVSYPDVSDVEKLSWLLVGRAPDAEGSDRALFMSLGGVLLGDGEPFYKQVGLDDLRVINGTGTGLGSLGSGSLLPEQTVASGGNPDIINRDQVATQILVLSKNLSESITLSLEQALSGSTTIGRLSYHLAQRWWVDLQGGDFNGLSLIYRTFRKD